MKRISELTVNDVDTAIRVLAAEYPDYVYNNTCREVACHYDRGVNGGAQSEGCIFGQAFQRLGADTHELAQVDINELWSDTHGADRPAPREWVKVQTAQDNGETWGYAIRHLKAVGDHELTPA